MNKWARDMDLIMRKQQRELLGSPGLLIYRQWRKSLLANMKPKSRFDRSEP